MERSDRIEWLRAAYLDASAAVKLVVDELGSREVEGYMEENPPLYISTVCVAETLGVLKRKWLRGELGEESYFRASFVFLAHLAQGGKIIVENDDLADSHVFFECEDLAKKHGLDLSDALQLYALKAGCLSDGVDESQALLITADMKLAAAARAEGLLVWNCEKEARPVLSESSATAFLEPRGD